LVVRTHPAPTQEGLDETGPKPLVAAGKEFLELIHKQEPLLAAALN